MKKQFFLILFLISFSIAGFAQEKNDSLNKKETVMFPKLPKNSIYFELLGAGVLYSINYERILFEKGRNSLNARVGFSYYRSWIPEFKMLTVPLFFNYQFRLRKGISLEIGGGYRFIHNSLNGNLGINFLIKRKTLFKINFTPQLHGFASKWNSTIWWFSKTGFAPVFGASMGFSFGKKNGMESKKAKEGLYNFSPKNSIYTEFLGSAIAGSVNYERFFLLNNHNGINARIGIGKKNNPNPLDDLLTAVPIGFNYQYLFNKVISFETGIGYIYVPQRENFDDNYFNGNVGFRFLLRNHLLFKINYTPQFSSKHGLLESNGLKYGTWFGISMGFSFGKKK